MALAFVSATRAFVAERVWFGATCARSRQAALAERNAASSAVARNVHRMRYGFALGACGAVVMTLCLMTDEVVFASSASDNNASALVMAISTVPDEKSADAIAHALVTERIVACVNAVGGVKSTYVWQGKVERDEERLLLMKTRAALVPKLRARLTELHPYDVPELIVHTIVDGSEPYLDWIRRSTQQL
eukprot:TRINITY_DN117_c0_g1_i2.p1 TRINITY_DN117_c0_g1~~TRINITY_DN117_c0_g1_i2.p1  ORF type:complete len:189 (-),score=40.89 TRINITY_DN117_c0_g1_i2:446-1012(-)